MRYRIRSEGREVGVQAAGQVLIGLPLDCGLRVGGGLVSRHHAQLEHGVHGLHIKDVVQVSEKTIESHYARITTKLGCGTRAEVVS